MNKPKQTTVAITLCLASFSHSVCANPADDFQQGKIFFNQGKYQLSLDNFNSARAQGYESPSLLYNLGSVHYKLEQYDLAEHYFLQLTENSPSQALAFYNLGLIANKKGNPGKAVDYFEKCQVFTANIELRELATRQIDALSKNIINPWSGYLYAGYGHDSNITAAPSGIASNQSGTFIKAAALANVNLTGTNDDGVASSMSIYSKNYLDSSLYDSDFLTFALSLNHSAKDWLYSYTADVMQSAYGNADYQRNYRVTLEAEKLLANDNRINLRYRYEDLNSLSPQFDYLDGTRQKIRAEYELRWPGDKLRLQVEHEINDRQNSATRNYSPTRNTVAIDYSKTLNSTSSTGVEASYRQGDYEPAPTLDREDDKFSTALWYSYRLDKNWKISGKIQYRENDSNDPALSYSRTISTASIARFF